MINHCDHIHDLFVEGKIPRGVPILSIITILNNTYFIELMQEEKGKQNQVENAFLSILSRKPKPNESNVLSGFVDE